MIDKLIKPIIASGNGGLISGWEGASSRRMATGTRPTSHGSLSFGCGIGGLLGLAQLRGLHECVDPRSFVMGGFFSGALARFRLGAAGTARMPGIFGILVGKAGQLISYFQQEPAHSKALHQQTSPGQKPTDEQATSPTPLSSPHAGPHLQAVQVEWKAPSSLHQSHYKFP